MLQIAAIAFFTFLVGTKALAQNTSEESRIAQLQADTGLQLANFDSNQARILTVMVNSIYILGSQNGFAGTPLHQKIFGGPIDGSVYKKWLTQRVNRLQKVDGKLAANVTAIGFKPERTKSLLFQQIFGNLDVDKAILVGPAFFRQMDNDKELDYVLHLAQLIRAAAEPSGDLVSCSAVGRFFGSIGSLYQSGCEDDINGGRAAEFVFLYNFVLSHDDFKWNLSSLVMPNEQTKLVGSARDEITADLRNTRFSNEWKP
jgi:hypothetical protein